MNKFNLVVIALLMTGLSFLLPVRIISPHSMGLGWLFNGFMPIGLGH